MAYTFVRELCFIKDDDKIHFIDLFLILDDIQESYQVLLLLLLLVIHCEKQFPTHVE